MTMYDVAKGYELAKAFYAQYGVDVDQAIARCNATPISMHCWQGDDVNGFEQKDGALTGGIQTTGNYPGKAQTRRSCARILRSRRSLCPAPKK